MGKTLREKSINQILYISIGSVLGILVLFIILFNVFANNIKKKNIIIGENDDGTAQIIEQANNPIGKTVSEVENEDLNSEGSLSVELSENSTQENLDEDENEEKKEMEKQENVAEVPNNVVENKVEEPAKQEKDVESDLPDPVFVKPAEGEIVKQYGKEKLIYSNTLKEWTAHLGIDIKADKTTIVKSSADGVVKSIKNDPRYGLTVVIEHNNGYASIYSNLLTAEFVTVGENVLSGQTIGTVGNSAKFEILDEPHLHFEITKDGVNVDPEMCIK